MISLDEAQRRGIVIGLAGETDKPVARLDIDELLLQYPKTFNLFLLALAYLQDETKSNDDNELKKMNYFQVAGMSKTHIMLKLLILIWRLGIHGLPLRDWDGVPGSQNDSEEGSYCPHGTRLFPTWHRPYLAMMEQTIYHRMLSIAKLFKEPGEHVEAVKKFRLPFWDYFRPRGGNIRFPGVRDPESGTTGYGWDFSIPYILEVERVMVFKPSTGKDPPEKEFQLQEIDNPLYKFTFPKAEGISKKDWDSVDTFRGSRSFTERQDNRLVGKSDHRQLNTVLAQRRESQVEALLNFFNPALAYNEYMNFSTSAWGEGAEVNGSVESLHDDYHGNCGGGRGGHMSHVPAAAFDPVFWLHHCNIDRIIAIWQGVNPGSWVPKQRGSPPHAIETDPLLPFRSIKSDSTVGFWTSKDVRRVESFGYTYTEIKDSPKSKDLANRVFRKYSWSSQAYNRGNSTLPADIKVLPLTDCPVFKYNTGNLESRLSTQFKVVPKQQISKNVAAPTMSSQQVLLSLPEAQTAVNIAPLEGLAAANQPVVTKDPPASEGKHLSQGAPNSEDQELLSGKPQGTHVLRQWYIDALVERAAFDGAFTVFYFVGDFPADVEHYSTAPTIAGTNYVFTAPSSACDNCGRQAEAGLRVSDATPITPILLDYLANGALNSLQPKDVVPFLKSNLHWRTVGLAIAESMSRSLGVTIRSISTYEFQANNTQPTPSNDVSGLKISVSSSVAYLYPGNPVPEPIAVQNYPEITAGRAGGVSV